MRLPCTKVYRAFREFDGMSDEECVRYLRIVLMRRRTRRWLPAAVGAVTLLGSCVLWPIVMNLTVGLLPANAAAGLERAMIVASPDGSLMISLMDLLVGFVAAFTVVGVPCLAGLTVRDMQIRAALRYQVGVARCPECRQSLIGLPVEQGPRGDRARCPECGGLWLLSELGLTASDLSVKSQPVSG